MIPLRDPDLLRRSTPYVTRAIIAANLAVGVITLLVLSDLDEIAAVFRYGVIPDELTGGEEFSSLFIQGLASPLDINSPVPTWAMMLTAMFLHGGFLHLGGNMLFLWVFGDNIEDSFGHVRFLIFYVVAGVAAVWAQVAVDPSSQTPMIGASGGVAGVLGAYIVLHPRSRVDTLIVIGFVFHARVPAFVLLGGWVGLQLFAGLGGPWGLPARAAVLPTSPTSVGSGPAWRLHSRSRR